MCCIDRKFNAYHRKVITEFKELHLAQQAQERAKLEETRELCRSEYNASGQPKYAMLFAGCD
jgi:hypothetical protein